MLKILSQFIKYFTLLYLSLPSPHGDAIISTNSIFYLKGSLLAEVGNSYIPKYFWSCHSPKTNEFQTLDSLWLFSLVAEVVREQQQVAMDGTDARLLKWAEIL